ncbi:MAG: SDR family oxidoreductase [Alphaproteobacteria bacterium]|nr:SDR family oxidoreductase [Alphaproteobacteria bacterium]
MSIHQGRHALITGGGTGIGEAIALALAAQGAEITIAGRRIDALNATCAKSDKIHAVVMDVTDEASVVNATKAAIKVRGPVDIHVANAGIAETSAFAKTPLDFWRKIMTTNLDGAFLTCREVVPGMLKSGWGRIITISSIAGLRGLKYGAAYSASKHGVIGMTRVISEEYMGRGLTANAICPGYVRTPIVTRNAELISKRSNLSLAEAEATMSSENRHQKLVEVDEVAAAVLWICGPGSGSINGQTIEIAGGQV